ncbi:hypothetical protein IJ114_03025 [Candidatus Saccharibacteria bacterium]|nr:hypothetical protein [Candidatus Saccharibacteria bacterium]
MKRYLKTGLSLAMMMGLGALLTTPVFAACPEGSVDTNLFGCVSGENGDGIYLVLNVILTVMTFGVGILGTIGIVIAGIQYATAKDNEQQMAKAKMRIFQIVIGMVIWAVLYFALRWLLPGFQNSVGGN